MDEDLQTKSYCTSKDETYDDGIIAMNNISEFKVFYRNIIYFYIRLMK